MKKCRKSQGFTLMEALLVTTLLAIVAGVSFVGVARYLRSMTKLQYDNCAREIFIAAQNHLSLAQSQGYLGRTDYGIRASEDGEEVYYFPVNTSADASGGLTGDSVLSLMLPATALDDSVLLDGQYILRYHRTSGQVLDVYYWEPAGRYAHTYDSVNDYGNFQNSGGSRDYLENYSQDHSVIGYYGGVEVQSVPRGQPLAEPGIDVSNGDQLRVTVTDPNWENASAQLKLVVTGLQSGGIGEIALSGSADHTYTVILDDVTGEGPHFSQRFSGLLIPGENISIQAVAYNNEALSSPVRSPERVTNSLFGDGTGYQGSPAVWTAGIGNIRHLENLSRDVSGVNGAAAAVQVGAAEQMADLSWAGFCGGSASIEALNGDATAAGCFLPVTPGYSLAYDGRGHSVSGLSVRTDGNAGLFGFLSGGSVADLELKELNGVSGGSAGALAGAAFETAFTNVLARGAAPVSGSAAAGGLIGSAESCTVRNCAASLPVRAQAGNAGGLIGSAENVSVYACYAAGHTRNGQYSETDPDVTAAQAAGGLVGEYTGGSVSYSYSTCSVSGSAAGGLAGKADIASAAHCYATGLVRGTAASDVGAFAGSLTVSDPDATVDCAYFRIVNETPGKGGPVSLAAVGRGSSDGIGAFDADIDAYDAFVGTDHGQAQPTDPLLTRLYRGGYLLKTVEQLGARVSPGDFVAVHYGDWPAPELWAVNLP